MLNPEQTMDFQGTKIELLKKSSQLHAIFVFRLRDWTKDRERKMTLPRQKSFTFQRAPR